MSWSARLKLLIVKMTYAGINAMLLVFRRMLWPVRPSGTPHTICLYRIGNVGDTVCALPAMRAVRRAYPAARLVLLTSPGRADMPGAGDVLQGNDWLDDLIVYYDTDIATWAGRQRLLRQLQSEHFDLWVELPSNSAKLRVQLRNMLFARLAGARWGGGWRLSTIRLWPQLQSDYILFPNEVERLLAIVREEGIKVEQIDYGLAGSSEADDATKGMLSRAGVANGQPLIAIAPGSKRTTNRWPLDRWIDVGRALTKGGYRVLLVGGPAELATCETIAKGIGTGAVNLAGRTNLPVLAQVLRRCTIALCVDSGVQHIAAAVGTRCVSLFSVWQHKGKWHPHGDHVVIEKRVPCHTCLLEHCPYENRCMREITVAEVIAAGAQFIHRGRTSDDQEPTVPMTTQLRPE